MVLKVLKSLKSLKWLARATRHVHSRVLLRGLATRFTSTTTSAHAHAPQRGSPSGPPGGDRKDIRIETYSPSILSKYSLTDEQILRNAVESFWNDPELNYWSPFPKDKEKNHYSSSFALLVMGMQSSLNTGPTKPKIQSKYPNCRSLLLFFNPGNDDNKSTSDGNGVHVESNNNDDKSFKYAGTCTICEPVINSKGAGFVDMIDANHPYIKKSVTRQVKEFGISTFINNAIIAANGELNRQIILKQVRMAINEHWNVEMFNVNPKYQGNGLGSYFFKYIFNDYIKNISQKCGYNGLVLLNTGNERTLGLYERFGFRVVIAYTCPTREDGEGGGIKYNTNSYWLLWHWDENIRDNAIKKIEDIGLDKNYKLKSISECMKWEMKQWFGI